MHFVVFYNYGFFFTAILLFCLHVFKLLSCVTYFQSCNVGLLVINNLGFLIICECLYVFIFFCERYFMLNVLGWQFFLCIFFLPVITLNISSHCLQAWLASPRSALYLTRGFHCVWWLTFLLLLQDFLLCQCPW